MSILHIFVFVLLSLDTLRFGFTDGLLEALKIAF